MDTLTIKIKGSKVLKLINDLADLNLIQVISTHVKKPVEKLSDILSGSITPEQAIRMHNELEQMRNKWERDSLN